MTEERQEGRRKGRKDEERQEGQRKAGMMEERQVFPENANRPIGTQAGHGEDSHSDPQPKYAL